MFSGHSQNKNISWVSIQVVNAYIRYANLQIVLSPLM